MKRMLWVTLVTVFGQSAFAQKDFKEGFIITNNGDSISAQINYRSSAKNYKSCLFLSGGEIIEYFPAEILGYGFVGDKYYESQIVDNFFAEVVISGELSLYKHKSSNYIKRKNEAPVLLEQAILTEESSDWRKSTVTKSNKEWRQKFATAIADCFNDPSDFVKDLNLLEKDLTQAVIEYNECRNLDYKYYKVDRAASKIELGLVGGFTFSTLNISGDLPILIRHLKNNYSSQDPFFGLMMNISSPRFSENISFQTEIQYSQSSFSSTVETNVTTRNEIHDSNIDLKMISIPISIKYQSNGGGLTYFVHAGGNIELLSGSDTSLNTLITNDDNTTENRSGQAFELRNSGFGPMIGFGVTRYFKNFKTDLTFRYLSVSQLNTENADFRGLDTKLNKAQLGLIISLL